jgi:polar amino acid transport system substrate-binding protein
VRTIVGAVIPGAHTRSSASLFLAASLIAAACLPGAPLGSGSESAAPSGSASAFRAPAELAPTGTLRVAFGIATSYIAKDANTGALSGFWPDLVQELATRAGVPYSVVEYPGIAAAVEGLRTTQWDISFADGANIRLLGLDSALDVTPGYVGIPWTYLVPAGSPIRVAADVDQSGVRVAVPAVRSITLVRGLKHATVVNTTTAAASFDRLKAGEVDALAGGMDVLPALASAAPGYRVVTDHPVVTYQVIAVRKGRPAALAYLTAFIEDAKKSGLIERLIARWGVRGAQVAPSAP